MIDNEARALAARNLDIVERLKRYPSGGVVVFDSHWTPSLRALLALQTGYTLRTVKTPRMGYCARVLYLEVSNA